MSSRALHAHYSRQAREAVARGEARDPESYDVSACASCGGTRRVIMRADSGTWYVLRRWDEDRDSTRTPDECPDCEPLPGAEDATLLAELPSGVVRLVRVERGADGVLELYTADRVSVVAVQSREATEEEYAYFEYARLVYGCALDVIARGAPGAVALLRTTGLDSDALLGDVARWLETHGRAGLASQVRAWRREDLEQFGQQAPADSTETSAGSAARSAS